MIDVSGRDDGSKRRVGVARFLIGACTIVAAMQVGPASTGHAADAATTTFAYVGDRFAIAGVDIPRIAVQLSSPDTSCIAGRTVTARSDLDGNGVFDPTETWTLTSGSDGVAERLLGGLVAGRYQVQMEVAGTPACASAGIAVDLLVADAGSWASGHGKFEFPAIGAGSITFHTRTSALPSAAASGSVNWRIDGVVRFSGRVWASTSTCRPTAAAGVRCATLEGIGTVWRWGTGTAAGRGWVRQTGEVEFVLEVFDVGSGRGDGATSCPRATADQFRLYLPGIEFLSKSASPLTLDRGDIRIG